MAVRADQLKTRAPLARMLAIHQQVQAKRYPSRSHLAKQLEISIKTVQRDVDFMRDRLGLPIVYDPTRHGYVYTEEVNQFPTLGMAQSEVLALKVAREVLKTYQGTPFEPAINSTLHKVGLLTQTHPNDNEDTLEHLTFRARGTALLDMALFQSLAQAIVELREVTFLYQKLASTVDERRSVHPYHLTSQDHQWYLIAYDNARKDLRTFALTRMKELHVTEQNFKPDHNFSLAQHLKDSFGISTNSGLYTVRIWFDALASKLVQERHWHATQSIRKLARGEIILTMTLGSLTEVKRWVLGWGAHARVLGPKKLIDRITQDLRTQAEYYLKGG